MKANAFIFGIFLVLGFSTLGNALDASVTFVTLNYGRGWWPYSCVIEKGMKFDSSIVCPIPDRICHNFKICETRRCSFFKSSAATDIIPYSCGAGGGRNAPGAHARISVQRDIKLLDEEDNVIADEICYGDLVKIEEGTAKGEWWGDGGHEDSPPIYWIDSVEDFADRLMKYHESITLKDLVLTEPLSDGQLDPLFGIPVYGSTIGGGEGENMSNLANMLGNIVCNKQTNFTDFQIEGLEKSGASFYKVSKKGGIDISLESPVECMFYLFGPPKTKTTYRIPTIVQNINAPRHMSWGVHNVNYEKIEDFFRIGTIGINKTLRVVEPSTASVELSPVFDKESLLSGKETIVNLKVKNTGNAEIDIKKVSSSNLDYKFVTCSSNKLAPGEEADCLLKVSATDLAFGLSLSVEYEYKNCGRRMKGTASAEIVNRSSLEPVKSTQVYHMNVEGACQNEYYACASPDKEGNFYAGYQCNNKEPYFVTSAERFNLMFDLSSLPENANILSAKLFFTVSKVNAPLAITLLAINDFDDKSCEPGGDICTQPYCKECAPGFDIAGTVVESKTISTVGTYSFDVTKLVKNNKQIALQIRGSNEDTWDLKGKDSCTKPKEWDHYDLVFSKPYLLVGYL
ncbi:MAG: hypothetical protein QXY62_06050 [Candidatus Altiarchaeota archaeon]